MARDGQSLHGIAELARLLRGKRVAFIGDSLTQQLLKSLECALMRERRSVGRMVTVKVWLNAPELVDSCRRLWEERHEETNRCAGMTLLLPPSSLPLSLWPMHIRSGC